MPFFRCSKIVGEADKQKFWKKFSENSRSQIVFPTDIFRKLAFGAPDCVECLIKQNDFTRRN